VSSDSRCNDRALTGVVTYQEVKVSMTAGAATNNTPDTGLTAPPIPGARESAHGGGTRTGAPPKDQALVKQLLAGDEAAFAALVTRYHGPLIRLALAFVADRAVAEEVVQETWLAVLNGLRSFEGRSTLKTWIFSILANKAKTRAVRERRSIPFSALMAVDDEPAVDAARFTSAGMWAAPPSRWDENTSEKLLLREEAWAVVHKAIAELPPAQRAVVSLRDVEGWDSPEIRNVLGISETNLRVLLHRARSRIRAELEEYVKQQQRPAIGADVSTVWLHRGDPPAHSRRISRDAGTAGALDMMAVTAQ